MIRIFTWLILLLPLPALSLNCDKVRQLSMVQKHNLSKSYSYGQPYELGYTLAAIALVESQAGKWRLNIKTGDVGLYQINYITAQNTLGVDRYYDQLALHERLVYDDVLGAEIAIATLEHFRANRVMTSVVWQEMIKSYNTGSQWKRNKQMGKRAEKYLTKVSTSVRLLKQCENYWR